MKRIIVLGIFITLLSFPVFSQPQEGKPTATPTPFGFTEILIAAGAAFGGKKAYDARKKSGEK